VQRNGGHILEALENIQNDIAFLVKKDSRVSEQHSYVGYEILEIFNSTTVCIQNIKASENKVESTHCITSSHIFEQVNNNNSLDSSSSSK